MNIALPVVSSSAPARVVVLTACWLCVGMPLAFAETDGLIVNGDFEATTQAIPPGWTHHTGLGGTAQVVAGAGHVHEGKQAVLLKPKAEPTNSSTVLFSGRVKIEPGRRYQATAWAKGKGRFELSFYQYSPKRAWKSGAGLGVVRVTDEWQLFTLHYGNPPPEIGFVALVLQASGAGSEVLVDDVSFAVVDSPAGPEGPGNGEVRAKEAGQGRAAGWSGPAQRMRVEPDGKGGFCQRFDARMLADDARGDLKQEDYFNYPVASGVTPPTWLSFNCKPFPVEPGTTQEISFRLRADGIHTFHIKLRYYDRDGKPYDIDSGVRPYFQLGGTRDGTWGYQRFVCRATSPTTAGKAQIEFWCLCGGGSIRVDDLSLKSLVAPPIHPAYFTTEWQELGGALPTSRSPIRRKTPASPAVHLTSKPEVTETPESVEVRLTNGVRLRLRRQGELVLGIDQVSLGSLRFRNPNAPLLAPLVETAEGGKYATCRYRGYEVSARGEVVLRTELTGPAGAGDNLNWYFAPHEVIVAGLTYRGVSVRYSFRSATNHVLQIIDRATWELGGDPIGLTVVDQNSYANRNVFLITEDSPYCSGRGTRFVAGECLDYQFSPEGALFAYFEKPSFVRYQRVGTPEFVIFRDAHQFAATKEATTIWKHVLFADQGSHDLWLKARNFAYARAGKQAGIAKQTPLPLANVWTDWQELAKVGKDKYYQKIIDDYLPAVARCGFKRLLIHETWEHGGCSPSDLAINSKFGGEAALKRLCAAAREKGIEVVAWYGPGHLWAKSPIFEKRPKFLLKGRGDKPPTNYCWPSITGVDLTGPWFDYAIGKLKGIRERTGLAGFWLDSYTNFTHGVKCATRQLEVEQAGALIRFHAAIQQLGYITYTEASSDFGTKSNGLPVGGLDSPEPSWPAPEELVDTSPYSGSWREEHEVRVAEGMAERDRYFRYLANKCVPFIYWRRFRDQPKWQEKIAAANHAYYAAVEFMDTRQLLPDGKGVLWTSADGRVQVMFAFRDQEMSVPKGKRVYLSPELKPVASVAKKTARLKAGNAYLLR